MKIKIATYSPELAQFIDYNRMRYNTQELCKLIEIHFNKKITPKTLRKYFYRHNIDFKKMTNQRQNCTIKHEIGHESNPDKNGLIRVKINEKQWVYKQRYIYEQHYGKIPKGYKVIFLNGDKTDFRIENLAAVPYKDVLYIYGQDLASTKPEMTKLALSVAKLRNKTIEIEKELK